MSDQERGKKMVEEAEVEYFLDAYEHVTGERLEVSPSESPDFIGERPDGTLVGLELTKIVRAPETAQWDEILWHEQHMETDDAREFAWALAEAKSRKMKENDWPCRDSMILVLQLMDCPLDSLMSYLGFDPEIMLHDYGSLGFAEVWLADYTGLEAYGDIELFGLYPKKWWGYYQRPNPGRKPYG